jgi:hypothetical protein
MVRRTKRRGGMLRTLGRPIGTAAVTLGKSLGKDYLRKKSVKVAEGVYDDPSLASDPKFMLTGNKPFPQPNIPIQPDNRENINTNIPINWDQINENKYGGKSRRRYKKIKTRKNKK